MPVVTVQMWTGRTVEQKRKLVAAITEAMVKHADCKPDHLHVIIQDVPNLSLSIAKRIAKKVSCIGMKISPPSESRA